MRKITLLLVLLVLAILVAGCGAQGTKQKPSITDGDTMDQGDSVDNGDTMDQGDKMDNGDEPDLPSFDFGDQKDDIGSLN